MRPHLDSVGRDLIGEIKLMPSCSPRLHRLRPQDSRLLL